MRHLLFTVALSLGFVTLCVGTLLGFRLWPTLGRALVVFLGTYVGGFLVSVIIGTAYLSGTEKEAPVLDGGGRTPSRSEGGRS